jgi:hypothetical protein
MGRHKQNRPTATSPRVGDVLGCFDADLCVRRHLFEDAVTICDIETGEPPKIPRGRSTTLQFDGEAFELSCVLDWLTPLADQRGCTYYLHHHDNIVIDIALVEPYKRVAFCRCLRLFRTRPAEQGGSNLLGVVGLRRAWILILENDNQGRFRIDFFGPADKCRGLRAHLDGPRPKNGHRRTSG